MLTDDKANPLFHRFILRSTTHKRARPQNQRFGQGSITDLLSLRKAGGRTWDERIDEENWIGKTWKN